MKKLPLVVILMISPLTESIYFIFYGAQLEKQQDILPLSKIDIQLLMRYPVPGYIKMELLVVDFGISVVGKMKTKWKFWESWAKSVFLFLMKNLFI